MNAYACALAYAGDGGGKELEARNWRGRLESAASLPRRRRHFRIDGLAYSFTAPMMKAMTTSTSSFQSLNSMKSIYPPFAQP